MDNVACEPVCSAPSVGSSVSTCAGSDDSWGTLASSTVLASSSPALAEDLARTETLRRRLAGGFDTLVAENEARMRAFQTRFAARGEIALAARDEDALGLDELRTAELRYRMASRRLEAVMREVGAMDS